MRLRTCDRKHLISSRIERARNTLDVAALACRIPSFIGDDDRDLLSVKLVMQISQFVLKLIKSLVVFLIGELLTLKLYLFQKRSLLKLKRVLQDRRSNIVVLECRLNSLVQELEHLELSKLLILTVYDVPRRRRVVGVLEILVVNLNAVVVMLVLIKVALIDTPLRILVVHELFETFLLLLLTDLEEELHDEITVINERPLSPVDRIDPLLILAVAQELFHPKVRDLLHPEGIIERELALLRDLLHVPVKERISQILLCRLRESLDPEKSRVDVLDDLA